METDFLVIGSGIAGLYFSLKASKYGRVVIITKDNIEQSNTLYAQGGLAAVFSKDDSIGQHVHDTLKAGDGLSNKKIATILAKEAPKEIMELKKLGVNFDSDANGFSLSKEAVHSHSRIVHALDTTGKEIEKILVKRVKENKNIVLFEYHTAIELITKKNKCIGCIALDLKQNKTANFFSKKTIIATGGLGRLYSITTNPETATGDGIAISFRAGTILEDMEFVQFHPTMLHNSFPVFLISESLRGEGGLLKNRFGKRFMKKYHKDAELAPRDVVSRASLIEMKKTRAKNVYLDMTHFDKKYLKKRFPNIYKECLKYGIDISKEMIPVSPAAHYLCGGIKTDKYGKTNINNLYAIGECACTQLHGANRLASNSLTEGLVFGTRLINRIKDDIKKEKIIKKKIRNILISNKKNGGIKKLKKQLQEIMWKYAGIIRNEKGLNIARKKIIDLEKKFKIIKKNAINEEIIELKNLILLGKIIIAAALRRKESRGTHFMEDYPEKNYKIWQKHLIIDKSMVS